MALKEAHYKSQRNRPGADPRAKGSLGSEDSKPKGSLHKVHLLVRCKLKAGQGFEFISESEICDKNYDVNIVAVKPPRVCNNGISSIAILMGSAKV